MGLQLDTANPFDLAVLIQLKKEGAQGWEIINKAMPDMSTPRVWFYAVRAESWATDWKYDDADDTDTNVRQFEVSADSRGRVRASRYGEALP
jgi:hypothetical protein